jgi:outer membrane receptor protein involved in Fe transport
VVLVNKNATGAHACLPGIALGLCTFTTNGQTAAPTASNVPTAAAGDSLAEVVVTAERRSENAQTVPIAISVIPGNTLAQTFGVNNVKTLEEAVPGLSISMDTGNTKIFLRGVGTTAVATDNSVGVYLDGIYIASQGSSFINLASIDHVEVDRGPQGTLFGRNTTGGVVQIVTKTPSSRPSADLTLGYGNYNTFAHRCESRRGLRLLLQQSGGKSRYQLDHRHQGHLSAELRSDSQPVALDADRRHRTDARARLHSGSSSHRPRVELSGGCDRRR